MSVSRIAQFAATLAGRTVITSNTVRTTTGIIVGFMNYPNSTAFLIYSNDGCGMSIDKLNKNFVVLFPQYNYLTDDIHMVNTKFDKLQIVPELPHSENYYLLHPDDFEYEIKNRIGKHVYYEEIGGYDIEVGEVCGYFYDVIGNMFMIIINITSCKSDPDECGFNVGQIEYILSEDTHDRMNYNIFIDSDYKDKKSLWPVSLEEFNKFCSL